MATATDSSNTFESRPSLSLFSLVSWIRDKLTPSEPESEPYYSSKAFELQKGQREALAALRKVRDRAYFP
ncbi:MAG: hypothetical protein ACXAE3_11785 [Candidatus Kariarchaeaceae archaeon]|jgi:hypothetical protein